MRIRLLLLAFCLAVAVLTCLPYPVNAEETEVIPGAKVTDPTNSGAASMSIPIVAPPGRGGIAPNLALVYNSYKGNGWVGVGWTLSLGEIQRNTKYGVTYSDTCSGDFVFTGNGTSSELTSRGDWGNNFFGAKIERDFSKFYCNSSTGGWEVTTKDGTKYYYGSTAASRQDFEGGSKVFKWFLERVQDTNGNYMTVAYVKDQGEVYLDRIEYTGNTGLNPSNYVQFYRESRTDSPVMYTTNYPVITAYRLNAIEVYGGGQLARKYVLNYKTDYSSSTSRSLLTSVTPYGSDGTTSLPNIQMSWQEWGKSFAAPINTGLTYSSGYNVHVADFTGGGYSGILIYNPNTSQYVLNWTYGASDHRFAPPINTGVNYYPGYNVHVADFNGDGKADILI
ncbi:MAG TPA: SpvB/TcaC N-terminal domain-containing protein, partial [Dissulfurispiraceae bacterium]